MIPPKGVAVFRHGLAGEGGVLRGAQTLAGWPHAKSPWRALERGKGKGKRSAALLGAGSAAAARQRRAPQDRHAKAGNVKGVARAPAVKIKSMRKKSISIPVFTESKGLIRLPPAPGAKVSLPFIYIGLKTACQGGTGAGVPNGEGERGRGMQGA
jgi:hypothetical protein